jgi:hypothetical protein
MLDRFRNQTGSLITYIMFSMIIIVFVFTFGVIGPDQACGTSGKTVAVAEVNEDTISSPELSMASALMLDYGSPTSRRYRQAQYMNSVWRYSFNPFGSQYMNGFAISDTNPEAPKEPTFYEDYGLNPPYGPVVITKALDHLLETFLVSQLAEELGLRANNAELRNRMPDQFLDDNQEHFDRDKWTAFSQRQIGAAVQRLEGFIRREMVREKLLALVLSGTVVTDTELNYTQRLSSEKIDLEFIRVDDASATKLIKVSDADTAKWLADKKNADATKAYYDKNKKKKFTREASYVFQSIQRKSTATRAQILTEKDATKKADLEKTRAAERNEAETLRKELLGQVKDAKKDAAKPATTKTADKKSPSAKTPEVAKKKDDAKGAVKVAKAAPKKVPATTKKAPAKPVATTISSKDFEAFAQKTNARENMKGGRFTKTKQSVNSIYPFGPGVAAALSKMKPGDLSGVIDGDYFFTVVRLEEVLSEKITSFEEAKNKIAVDLIRTGQLAAFKKQLAEDILAEAKKDPKANLAKVATAVNTARKFDGGDVINARDTGLFPRMQLGIRNAEQIGYIQGIGKSQDLLRDGFAATMDKPFLGKIYTLDKGTTLVIARLKGHTDASKMTDDEKTAVVNALLEQKKKAIYLAWYESLRDGATRTSKIKISSAFNATVKQQQKAWDDQYNRKGGKKGLRIPGLGLGGR